MCDISEYLLFNIKLYTAYCGLLSYIYTQYCVLYIINYCTIKYFKKVMGILFCCLCGKSLHLLAFIINPYFRLVAMVKPKVEIKIYQLSRARIFSVLLCQNLFPCFLTFCSNERSIPAHFLNFKLLIIVLAEIFKGIMIDILYNEVSSPSHYQYVLCRLKLQLRNQDCLNWRRT